MASISIDTAHVPDIQQDSVTILGTRYKVFTGSKGGKYVMRVRTRDTSAGKAGSEYKYYLPKG